MTIRFNSKFNWKISLVAMLLLGFSFAIQAQDYQRIQSLLNKGKYINNEGGTLQADRIATGWWSAQWIVEKVEGTKYVRFKNRHKPNEYLHNQNGKLECGPIQDGWWSAQWWLRRVPATPIAQIINRWKSDEYLHLENGTLKCSAIKVPGETTQWSVSSISDRVLNPLSADIVKKETKPVEEKKTDIIMNKGYYVNVTATVNNKSDWQVSYRFTYGDGSKSKWYYTNAKSKTSVNTDAKSIADIEFQWKDIATWKKLGSYTKRIDNYQSGGGVNIRPAPAQSTVSIGIEGSVFPRKPIRLVE